MDSPEDAALDAAAKALRVDLAPADRAAVAANLVVLAQMAALVEAAPLGPYDDPLPLFRP